MRLLPASLLAASIAVGACRAGAREGLGPTGIPVGTARASDPVTGPASDSQKSAPLTVWKAEYYKISDG